MLTKLLPEQISTFWPILKYAVEESLPPIVGEHPDKMNRVLSSMLIGDLEVWASYKKESNKFEAIIVTQFLYDEPSHTKNLLIYCLYSYDKIGLDSWIEGKLALVKYAKSKGCSAIIAYSANPFIVEVSKKQGADTSYTFISIDVNKIV